ncbi:hypothetical protein AB1Y20_002683 [Prymnesium parvum]|uniref:Uncharacterized protein n=1 Tax=Prymnesium parvum TaxID=97485 RepID=A0AB34JA67_PRYPA
MAYALQPNGTNRLRKPQLLIARNVLADAPDAATVEGCQSCSLCYRGLLSDVLINNCVLAVVLCTLALSCAVHSEEPMTRRLFFLPYGLCCVSVQLFVSAVAGAEGFSLVWCALLGLLTHAHLAFLVHGGEVAEPKVPSVVVAAAAAAVGGAALAYYALREHVLSTVAHLVAGGVGFGSSAVERVCSTQTFIAVGTLGVVILTALCICHWLRHARAQLAAQSDGTISDSSTRPDGFAAVKSQEGVLPRRKVTTWGYNFERRSCNSSDQTLA